MSIKKYAINGNEYMFFNDSYGNRSGFVHKTALHLNDRLIGENKIQYYNRTWECYTYQSVMKRVVRALLEEEFNIFKEGWKLSHNVKRLTKAKESEMMQDLAENKPAIYADLQELYMLL